MNIFQEFEYEIEREMVSSNSTENAVYNAVLYAYQGTEKKVVMPHEIEGYPVVFIHETFAGKNNLEEIIFPKHLRFLESTSLTGCTSLKRIQLPSSLHTLGWDVFQDCLSLEEITFSDQSSAIENIQFGQNVLGNNENFCDNEGFISISTLLLGYRGGASKIIIPDGITKIVEYAFEKNSQLTSVIMPDSVTTIGKAAFTQCSNLEEITLSPHIEILEFAIFQDCTSLETITLPEKLTEIQRSAFLRCTQLKHIQWNPNLTKLSISSFDSCISLEEITFPDSLTKVNGSFSGCESLRKITIPPSVEHIYRRSFVNCPSLEEVIFLPREEKCNIHPGAFPYSEKMRQNFLERGEELSPEILTGLLKIHKKQYRQDLLSKWNSISQQERDYFLEKWKKKTKVDFPNDRNPMRDLVFFNSPAEIVALYFREDCHLNYPELELYLQHSIEEEDTEKTALLLEYQQKNFSRKWIDQVETRKQLVEIGLALPTLEELQKKWFTHQTGYSIIITGYRGSNGRESLPPRLEDGTPILKIVSGPFGFKRLQELFLPEGFETIGSNCFLSTPLRHITIPNSVTSIKQQAFMGSALQEITLPSSLTTLPYKLFSGCTSLKKVVLPNSLTEIMQFVFFGCKSLEEIHLPKGLTTINESAFALCEHLTKIHLPDSLTHISPATFDQCISLEEIRLPKGIQKIENLAFDHCTKLKKVILSHESIQIQDYAFQSCPSLEFVGVEDGTNLLEKLPKPSPLL